MSSLVKNRDLIFAWIDDEIDDKDIDTGVYIHDRKKDDCFNQGDVAPYRVDMQAMIGKKPNQYQEYMVQINRDGKRNHQSRSARGQLSGSSSYSKGYGVIKQARMALPDAKTWKKAMKWACDRCDEEHPTKKKNPYYRTVRLDEGGLCTLEETGETFQGFDHNEPNPKPAPAADTGKNTKNKGKKGGK